MAKRKTISKSRKSPSKSVKRKAVKRATKRSPAKRKIKTAPPKKRVVKRTLKKPKRAAKKSSKRTSTRISLAALKPNVKWSPYALAYSLGVVNALGVLSLSILGKGQELLSSLLFSYSRSVVGVAIGMVEAAIWGLLAGAVLAWLYNKFK